MHGPRAERPALGQSGLPALPLWLLPSRQGTRGRDLRPPGCRPRGGWTEERAVKRGGGLTGCFRGPCGLCWPSGSVDGGQAVKVGLFGVGVGEG